MGADDYIDRLDKYFESTSKLICEILFYNKVNFRV